jgi:hypothetical protein
MTRIAKLTHPLLVSFFRCSAISTGAAPPATTADYFFAASGASGCAL